VYDPIIDPGEGWNLCEQTMNMGWVLRRITEQMATVQRTINASNAAWL
jgi:hypothetical protein